MPGHEILRVLFRVGNSDRLIRAKREILCYKQDKKKCGSSLRQPDRSRAGKKTPRAASEIHSRRESLRVRNNQRDRRRAGPGREKRLARRAKSIPGENHGESETRRAGGERNPFQASVPARITASEKQDGLRRAKTIPGEFPGEYYGE